MTTALCLGGAAGVRKDWTAALALGDFDFIVACNDVGAIWPGRLDAWCTLHPERLADWRDQRRANGYPDSVRHLVHGDHPPDWAELVEYRFPGQGHSGSSGLFSAKVALIDLGADRVVLAGIPMARTSHFFDDAAWDEADHYRSAWEALRPAYRDRMRSMSGWTAQFLGTPMEIPSMTKITRDKIAYEPHPVSAERKAELRSQGFTIIDAAFEPPRDPLDHDGDGKKGGSPKQEPSAELADLRASYESRFGKKPFMGWDAAELQKRIAATG